MVNKNRQSIAVIGSGISGLSAAWLLSKSHDVTLFEKRNRFGGHSNSINVDLSNNHGSINTPVDTGFIVYNELTYPNLTKFFEHLNIKTEKSNMSFSASIQQGRFEYAGTGLSGLLAQKYNVLRPRFWSMIKGILRFYQSSRKDAMLEINNTITLGEYLHREKYSKSFIRDHIYPMAGCIWSASFEEIENYPLRAFVRFFANHGLLETRAENRPEWRTVSGGSQNYVKRVIDSIHGTCLKKKSVSSLSREKNHIEVHTCDGHQHTFDQVVIATHSDQAISMLQQPTEQEKRILHRIRYAKNSVVLHTDTGLMPVQKKAWASWNYLSGNNGNLDTSTSLTYWMNRLQNIDYQFPLFVTLNPFRKIPESKILNSFTYDHPMFDAAALFAQEKLWEIQGHNRTWYCGAYLGYGFHEDGLQAGLSVAEAIGSVRRPWNTDELQNRICINHNIAERL